MKARWVLWGLLLTAAQALAQSETAATKFEVYTLHAPVSEAVEQTIRHLAGPEGQVTVEPPYRLLVVTTEENHQRIADAVKQLDVMPVNVRLTVRYARTAREVQKEASVGGTGEIVYEGGIAKTKIRVKPRIQDETTVSSERTAQTLLVASGREAAIAVGEEVPYLSWIMDYGRRCGVVEAEFDWQRVGAFLVAQPEVVGNGPLIRIRLVPELRGWVNGAPHRIRFSHVATEVVVQEGQPFQLGGLDRDAEFYSRFLVGRSHDGSESSLQITLTADIVRPTGP